MRYIKQKLNKIPNQNLVLNYHKKKKKKKNTNTKFTHTKVYIFNIIIKLGAVFLKKNEKLSLSIIKKN